jgi:SDR family mycofactocin-dependent oxidoreductase
VPGRVAGKVAFITGAARGQGRAHAIRLAEEGADIIAVDICDDIVSTRRLYPGATEADLAETVRQVEALGRRIVAGRADVRDYESLRDALGRGIAELGRLDVVVANAGVFGFGEPAHLVEPSQWAEVIDINLTGTWHTVRAAVPVLVEQRSGGSIVITSSTAAHKGTPHLAAYASSKLGQVGLMRTLAAELGPHQIRVNTVHPTGVATDMILNESTYRLVLPDAAHPTAEQAAEVFVTAHALPVPWVEPIDVSNAVLFLASDEARYITGVELKVDAGYTL